VLIERARFRWALLGEAPMEAFVCHYKEFGKKVKFKIKIDLIFIFSESVVSIVVSEGPAVQGIYQQVSML
jgi:hypothetical protein